MITLMDFLMNFITVNPAGQYRVIFGGIIGIIILFFSIIITIAVVIGLCVFNKNCPIYKWQQRRGQPPIGVIDIVADVPNETPLLDAMEVESMG